MKTIYLAYPVTSGDHKLPHIHFAISHLKKKNTIVIQPSYHFFPDILASTTLQGIEKSDCIIADVTTYSHGVGFELGYAYALGKNILVICQLRAKEKVSKFILGLFPNMIFYSDQQDLENKIKPVLSMAKK